MKKDGIQTRNRKLSAKKKKKAMLGFPDMLRCDKTGAAGGGFGGFGAHGGYSMYSMYGNQHIAAAAVAAAAAASSSSMAGGLMGPGGQGSYHGHQHHPGMHSMSGLGLPSASPAGGGPMGLGGGFCTVGA